MNKVTMDEFKQTFTADEEEDVQNERSAFMKSLNAEGKLSNQS